jgi:hypothetical protein
MRLSALAALASCLALPACIQKSDTRTFYLHPDGKVDVVMFLDDIHSSVAGPKGAEEEKQWLADFRKNATLELKQLRQTRAHAISARLLRAQPPYSAVIQASYGSIEDFGALFDITPGDPASRIRLTRDGAKRTLAIHVASAARPKESGASGGSGDIDDERLVLWRFVPVGGSLTETKACVADKEKRSCTLDVRDIEKQERAAGAIDVTIGWDTGPAG